jgi:hypothetical protein
MTISCNVVQECIVLGEVLDEVSQRHVLDCRQCARVAADFLALDARVADELSSSVAVPEGFADRVMAGLDEASLLRGEGKLERLLGRRWVQIGLAYVGVTVALVNLLRFVLGSLIPGASLGGIR